MTVLMTDLANYTKFTETQSAEKVVATLNGYFAIVVEEVEKQGGFVAQFAGDAAVSYFGAPLFDEDHSASAVRAASAIVERLDKYFAAAPHTQTLSTRCGIETGPLIVGNIGTPKRLNYAAVGPAINRTQRLQEAGKMLGTKIVIGEQCYLNCQGDFSFRFAGAHQLRGVPDPVPLYVLAPHPAPPLNTRR